MNVRKQMNLEEKLITELPLSVNFHLNDSPKKSWTGFSSPLKKRHQRTKSGPLSIASDFKITSRPKDDMFRTATRHKKSQSYLTDLQMEHTKSSFKILIQRDQNSIRDSRSGSIQGQTKSHKRQGSAIISRATSK
jgi:hypothetical protein